MTDVQKEVESKLEYFKIQGCSVAFNVRKILLKEEKLSVNILPDEELLSLGFSCTFKSSAKLRKELFADKPYFQK